MRAQNGNVENGLMNMYRSGSAPPTIEGSYNALNSPFKNLDFTNEEEMRSHPAYLSYYYSHDNNINPRLPPPLLSKEEWRMQQRLKSYRHDLNWRNRGIAHQRANASSLFVVDQKVVGPELRRASRSLTPSLEVASIVGSYVTNGKSSSMNNLSDFAADFPVLNGLDHSQNRLGDSHQVKFQANMPISNTRIPIVPKYGHGGHSNNLPNSGGQLHGRCGNNMQLLDHHYLPSDVQYYRHHPPNQNLLVGGKYINTTHSDLQKAQFDALICGQQRYGLPFLQKSHNGITNDGYYEGLAYLLGMPYQGASMANSLGDIRFGNYILQCDISATMKGMTGATLLEEFKNKSRPFQLSDIVGHLVEFSMDQCGSRFIQQKLETCTNEEKMKVFHEIAPHARTLMTDVFGNYVIQKFFERGTDSQRNILASKIKGHVLQLSLQMYGCRVIQKALETLDMDEKTQLVVELDGSVLKCVRDQNGNHVIQKCIECIPEARIEFITTSFFGQVVSLSTHPYGCRVIQRVLEHCSSKDTQNRIMEEIMQSIVTLAQDQYGNYVIQHVIQHGKPEERSTIISKLGDQVVKMSQQKFASNVIEKCLTFGTPQERQVLVNEMLISTDATEPLQEMMKDPFGNYVVQKVLEMCDEETREMILSRIKLHLCDLKKYTYVKHVVSRVEKLLLASGERSPVPE